MAVMGVVVVRRRPLCRLGELPCLAWLSLHTLLYLGVVAAAVALWELGLQRDLTRTLVTLIVAIAWCSPLLALLSLAAACCQGVLRVLADIRWYWFRMAALLLFAAPLPLFLLNVDGLAVALSVAAVQLVTALLIVQPREGPAGWADRDPTMGDHRW
jgi:hypothetical protein